ncbi:phospho-sugar mutase [Cellulomonas cellasea]|uniref:Phosphomannomutase n=1 Tax=Cellulomonas cellasea TaxID=43670 RepID=A0A4Y3L3Y0_9CELL|nr:phospho-sugar mutase [Cellulomonas cellasea]GEA89548.1 phosphomannomutase [Cellulomonas cellasea]
MAYDWNELSARVTTWIEDDPDPTTADELARLLDRANAPVDDALAAERGGGPVSPTHQTQLTDVRGARADLADRFTGLLQFGTAGLRGAIGGGPHRMNRAVVIRAASGLADYLLGELDGLTPAPRVVVGYDARHRSADFARDTAAVMTAVGIEVLVLPRALPTPVLAFAVRHLGADAGVMVTASHNPPQDNGYKVYLGGRVVTGSGQGAQIVPPYDAAIAAEIARVPSVVAVPRAESGWTVLGDDVLDAYVSTVTALADLTEEARERARHLKIVLTPLHGVGGEVAARVLREAGFRDVLLVPEQEWPDPDFPSVAFPNPEEPGAMDLALGLAGDVGADLVLALDPDADRCAVALNDPTARSHRGPDTAGAEGWRMLHGDEVGAVLGSVVASRLAARTATGTTAGAGAVADGGAAAGRSTGDGVPVGGAAAATQVPALASSIVSSRLLAKVARAAGLRHQPTLTGFKWLARVDGLAFGYEEALGYCVDPAHVRDKDGISAALLVAGLAATLKASGRTLLSVLDDLAREHGLHLSDQVSARFTDLDRIPATMAALREHPPVTLAGSPVMEVVDLATATDAERQGLPATEGLRITSQDGTRVVVRPSGTEPKVKCYLEVIVPVSRTADAAALVSARKEARARLHAVASDVSAALGI